MNSLSKKQKILAAAGVVVAILAGYFIYDYFTYVSTDNASVQAHSLMLAPRVAGTVVKVLVDENQIVKKGDLLAQLDDRDYSNAVAQAEGELASLEAQLQDAEANYQRIFRLFKAAAISKQQFDDTQAKFRDLSEKKRSAQAAVEQARLNLSYTQIQAPSDGKIARKTVEVGMQVPAGQPLFGFVSSDGRWVDANFKETELDHIRPGEKVKVEVDALPGRKFNGEVESISSSTGATFALLPPDNSTGNFTKVVQRVPVKIRLTDLSADDIDRLQAGLSAEVYVRIR